MVAAGVGPGTKPIAPFAVRDHYCAHFRRRIAERTALRRTSSRGTRQYHQREEKRPRNEHRQGVMEERPMAAKNHASRMLRASSGVATSCPIARIIPDARSANCGLLSWPSCAYW